MNRKRYHEDRGMIIGAVSAVSLMIVWLMCVATHHTENTMPRGVTMRHEYISQFAAASFCSLFFGGLQWTRITIQHKLNRR